MMRIHKRLGFGTVLVLGIQAAACGTSAASPTQLPALVATDPGIATPGSRALRVAASPVAPSECTGNTASGFLTENDESGLGLVDESGVRTAVTWPPGFSAAPSIGGVLLKDDSGKIVARTGEIVTLIGVLADVRGLLACGRVEIGGPD